MLQKLWQPICKIIGGDIMERGKGKKAGSKKRDNMPAWTETMAGAERHSMDIKNRVSYPSDDSVEEMRLWCIENKK